MSSREKQLGTGLENRVVARAQARGIPARKQPLSGVLKEFPADVVLAERLLVECKVRSISLDAGGGEHLKISLPYLRKVQAEAVRAGFAAGLLVYNAKGSQKPVVLLDLDDFLHLLTEKDGS